MAQQFKVVRPCAGTIELVMFGHFFAPEISPPTAFGATEPVLGTKTSELAAFYEVVSLILPPAIICQAPRAQQFITSFSTIIFGQFIL